MARVPRWLKLFGGALAASLLLAAVLLVGLDRWVRRADRPAASAVAWTLQQQPTPTSAADLPRLWRVPVFKGRTQDGALIDDQGLKGRTWLADFIYTRCTSACPMLTARLILLSRRAPPGLGLLSFSVDPKNDDPATLAAYTRRWPRPNRPWTLITTGDAGIGGLAEGMHIDVDRSPDQPDDITHTTQLFLIDASGWVRGVYDSADDGALSRLMRDAALLVGAKAPPAAAGHPPPAAGADGARLFAELGCAGCHADPRLAPPLGGFGQRKIRLESGPDAVSDAAYLRQSIVEPWARLVKGYGQTMPSYASALTGPQVDALVGYLLGLPAPAGPAAAGAAVDPVCHMRVPVVAGTPRVARDGQTYYFCSETCRAKFQSHPARYLANPAAAAGAARTTAAMP
jgi:protein SCO1/2